MTERSDDRRVRIYEVGPRDGLQNEARRSSPAGKLALHRAPVATPALREIEATSSFAEGDPAARRRRGARPLCPRRAAVALSACSSRTSAAWPARRPPAGSAIAVFTAASETFNRRTQHRHDDRRVTRRVRAGRRPGAGRAGRWRRAYVSTVFGCPYEGAVDAARAAVTSPCGWSSASTRSPSATRSASPRRAGAGDRCSAGSARASRASGSRSTSTTRAARRSPTSWPGLSCGVRDASMPRPGGIGGCPYAPGRRRQPGDRGSRLLARRPGHGRTASISTASSMRPASSRRCSAGRSHQGGPGRRLGPSHAEPPPAATGTAVP